MIFHGNNLRAEGISDDDIKRIARLDKDILTPLELAILKFAQKAAKSAHRITDMEFNQLKQLGLTDHDLVVIIGTVALASANYIIIDSLDLRPPPWIEPIILEEMEG